LPTPKRVFIDGGNSTSTISAPRNGAEEIHYDVGTSGGVWGLRGYRMIGAKMAWLNSRSIRHTGSVGEIERTPGATRWAFAEQAYHCGPNGAGHFSRCAITASSTALACLAEGSRHLARHTRQT
jgi:6-phosphogluconate dehydrogenase (decarboxylating)